MKNILLPFDRQLSFGFWRGNFVLTLCRRCLAFFVCFDLLLGFLTSNSNNNILRALDLAFKNILGWINNEPRIGVLIDNNGYTVEVLTDNGLMLMQDGDGDGDDNESGGDSYPPTPTDRDELYKDQTELTKIEKALQNGEPGAREKLAKYEDKYPKELEGVNNSSEFINKARNKIFKKLSDIFKGGGSGGSSGGPSGAGGSSGAGSSSGAGNSTGDSTSGTSKYVISVYSFFVGVLEAISETIQSISSLFF